MCVMPWKVHEHNLVGQSVHQHARVEDVSRVAVEVDKHPLSSLPLVLRHPRIQRTETLAIELRSEVWIVLLGPRRLVHVPFTT